MFLVETMRAQADFPDATGPRFERLSLGLLTLSPHVDLRL